MIDVILYKPSPYGLVFVHDKSLGIIIYHIKHERVYVSYITSLSEAKSFELYVNGFINGPHIFFLFFRS